jgi:hypothetical protein
LIPKEFNSHGVLKSGTYEASFEDIRSSILVRGSGQDNWDHEWRLFLTNQAEKLVKQLWKVGIRDVYLDGSFVEDKTHPNDIDGYFDPGLSQLNRNDMMRFQEMISELNRLDPWQCWNWDPQSRQKVFGFQKKQLPMWVKYRVELFPHLDQGTGIKDEQGNEMTFPSAFRHTRFGFKPKGIIKVIEKESSGD